MWANGLAGMGFVFGLLLTGAALGLGLAALKNAFDFALPLWILFAALLLSSFSIAFLLGWLGYRWGRTLDTSDNSEPSTKE
jgi:hypothetical protein